MAILELINGVLTNRQEQVHQFLVRHMEIHQRPPTQTEIARALRSKGRTGVLKHLKKLEEAGLIGLERGKSRGITMITRPGPDNIEVPIVGKLTAGLAVDSFRNIEGDATVSRNLFEKKPDYFVRIASTMMEDFGMQPGDLAAIKKQRKAESGQIVLLDERSEPILVRLVNDAFRWWVVQGCREGGWEPYRVNPKKLRIEGVFLGLIRSQPWSDNTKSTSFWLIPKPERSSRPRKGK